MNEPTFGARIRGISPGALLDLERLHNRSERFAEIDAAVFELGARALRGERVVRLQRTDRGVRLELPNFDEPTHQGLRARLQLEAQQAKGAWFLPESVSLRAGALSLPAILRESPRYLHTLIAEEKGKVALEGEPAAMLAWSVLLPLFELLVAPITFRVEESGLLDRNEFEERWSLLHDSLTNLGLNLDLQLAPFAWAGGWATFGIAEQLAAKTVLMDAISRQWSEDVVRLSRAKVVGTLIGQYYSKAKAGRAKRRQVVTKEHAPALAGYFGGDWLAFIDYLGETPHDEERIVTALPEPRLVVAGTTKASELAEKKGVSLEEVERILQAFWNDSRGTSPVAERAAAMADFWREFDAIHARQARGLAPLWGLVDEGSGLLAEQSGSPYQSGLYRSLLPTALVAAIERLWGTTVLNKWPDSVVSEPFPHVSMADAFGPALSFWHGCGLTAWFVCEGPMSRTDVPGLAEYHRRELVALEDMGMPVPRRFFEDLSAVPLGPPEPLYEDSDNLGTGGGVTITIQLSRGSRRTGFDRLRDVITRHRRQWASQYLNAYVKARWENELRSAARHFHLLTEEKGKAPTVKQFVKFAGDPARHWFGGDLSLLYSAIGQRFPAPGIRRSLRMPSDRTVLAETVFRALGGVPFERMTLVDSAEDGKIQAAAQDRNHKLVRLANQSLKYLQLAEALGRGPTLAEFGARDFEWLGEALAADPNIAWQTYSTTIDRIASRDRGRSAP